MVYVDIPTREAFKKLYEMRGDGCVSMYIETNPVTPFSNESHIMISDFLKEVTAELKAIHFDKRKLKALKAQFEPLLQDKEFWRRQAHSLAIFATPDELWTYRLPNRLQPMVEVADRFHLKPLLRAITFPHAAFILAISENAVRLVEIDAELPPETVKVPNLPKDAASSAGKSTLNDRSPHGRIQGLEGQNVRFYQYASQIDKAITPILQERNIPLILAGTARLPAIFRSISNYPHLLKEEIKISPDRLSDAELAEAARPILDEANQQEIEDLRALFETRFGEGRATTDIVTAAKAATFGSIDTLLVDIDSFVPGTVDEITGNVHFEEEPKAISYGVVDEIAGRAFSTGARVLGVRAEDLPQNAKLAATLRYTL